MGRAETSSSLLWFGHLLTVGYWWKCRATMVTAILPSLTDEGDLSDGRSPSRYKPNQRLSVAFSVESEATITPERYTRSLSNDSRSSRQQQDAVAKSAKPSALAGLVGLFTGCGALVALSLFLPLPARFGDIDGVTPGQAVSYSFYVVGAVSLAVALFVFIGLRNLKGEEGKGWTVLFGISERDAYARLGENGEDRTQRQVCMLQTRCREIFEASSLD